MKFNKQKVIKVLPFLMFGCEYAVIDKVEMVPSTTFSFDSNTCELSISNPTVLPRKYTLTFNVWLKGAVNPITVTLSVTVVE